MGKLLALKLEGVDYNNGKTLILEAGSLNSSSGFCAVGSCTSHSPSLKPSVLICKMRELKCVISVSPSISNMWTPVLLTVEDGAVLCSNRNLSTEGACGPRLLVNPVRDKTKSEDRVKRICSLIKHAEKQGNKIKKESHANVLD